MKKKKKLNPSLPRETIEDFLARGGTINRIPPSTPIEILHSVRVSTTPENRILSLDDGEFYFAENRKSNKKTKQVYLADVIDNFNLPEDVVNRLKGGADV